MLGLKKNISSVGEREWFLCLGKCHPASGSELITDLLWLVSPHHPAAATAFLSWAQSLGNFAQEEFGFFFP